MMAILWVAILLVGGLAVMVLEVFLPSGGILGFLSLAAIVAAIGMSFVEMGATAGMLVLGAATVGVPLVLALAFRWFPETSLGRRVLPPPPDPADVAPSAARRRELERLVGRSGRAVTDMLPWGVVEIEGVRLEAVSEGGPVESGAAVLAVGLQGRDLVVTPARGLGRPPGASGPSPPGAEAQAASDGGSQTLETFEFDRLEPPPP